MTFTNNPFLSPPSHVSLPPQIRGALVIKGPPNQAMLVKDVCVDNAGWEWVALDRARAPHTEVEKLHGFRVIRHGQRVIEPSGPGTQVCTGSRVGLSC